MGDGTGEKGDVCRRRRRRWLIGGLSHSQTEPAELTIRMRIEVI